MLALNNIILCGEPTARVAASASAGSMWFTRDGEPSRWRTPRFLVLKWLPDHPNLLPRRFHQGCKFWLRWVGTRSSLSSIVFQMGSTRQKSTSEAVVPNSDHISAQRRNKQLQRHFCIPWTLFSENSSKRKPSFFVRPLAKPIGSLSLAKHRTPSFLRDGQARVKGRRSAKYTSTTCPPHSTVCCKLGMDILSVLIVSGIASSCLSASSSAKTHVMLDTVLASWLTPQRVLAVDSESGCNAPRLSSGAPRA